MNIQKNIPFPIRRVGLTHDLRNLEIGDSRLFNSSARSSIYQLAKNIGIKIITSSEDDQIRVWRTE